MASQQAKGARHGVWAVTAALLLMVASFGHAQGTADRPVGRGFVWGGGLSAGRLSFPGGGDVALAAGDVTGAFSIGGEMVATREGQLTAASGADTAGAAHLVAFPATDTSAGFYFHVGYAFSRRVALLLEAELVAGVESGFSTAMGGVVVRYWPTSRLWLEAGPASGDLRYGYENTVVEEFAGTGYGVRTGVGFTVLRKPRWALDLEGRFGTLSFDGLRATSISVGLSASSRPR